MISKHDDDFELKFFEGIVKRCPGYVDALIPLAEIYTKRGLYKQGLSLDLRLSKLRSNDPTIHYNLACSYALVGKKDDALSSLMIAIQLGYDDVEHLKNDPDLKTLHSHPAFQQLLKTI